MRTRGFKFGVRPCLKDEIARLTYSMEGDYLVITTVRVEGNAETVTITRYFKRAYR